MIKYRIYNHIYNVLYSYILYYIYSLYMTYMTIWNHLARLFIYDVHFMI